MFKTELVARLIDNADGRWQLEMPLVFVSSIARTIIVPGGFETDFASSFLFGSTAYAAATVHDYLYRVPSWPITRKKADDVFYEAMEATGVPWWRRQLMYAGVRAGGGSAFKKRTT